MTRRVAALFVSSRSIYKHLPYVDAYCRSRNALSFGGGLPVVAHPPCRCWSRLRHQVTLSPCERIREMYLGFWAVETVMRCGGVLEQPANSILFEVCHLPLPGDYSDPFCYTVYVHQSSYGFPIPKPTWLLVCGVPRHLLPSPRLPVLPEGKPTFSELTAFQRSQTTLSFARYLCSIAFSSWWPLASAGGMAQPAGLACARDLARSGEMV